MQNDLEPRHDGIHAMELHLHQHAPAPPPPDLIAQALKKKLSEDGEDERPRRRRRRREPRSRTGRFFARALALGWEILGFLGLGFLNVLVLSKGLVELSPGLFGAKVSTMPGFGFMAGYQMWNKVQVGHVIALGFFCVMAFAWKLVVRDLVLRHGNDIVDESEWNVRNSRLFWRIACGVLMGTDALLFFYGVTQSSLWDKQPSYVSALISTAMYLAIVAVYSFGCLYFWDWERSE